MLVICIQCHGNTEHLPWLLSCLKHRDIRFVVSYDGSAEAFAETRERVRAAAEEAHLIHSMPVAWGGQSVVEAMLLSMAEALQRYPALSQVIFLSGACVPLMPPSEIVAFFHNKARDGKDVFLADFAPKEAAEAINDERHATGRFSPSLIAKGRGISIEYDEALADWFAQPGESPIRRAGRRFGMVVLEKPLAKTFIIRPLQPSERALRQHFARLGALRLGRQWISLSRGMAEWFADPSHAAGIRQCIMQNFIPDKSYFQSAIRLSPKQLRERVERSNFRLSGGGAVQINDATIGQIVDTHWGKMLFGRKIDHSKGNAVRNIISERCR